MELCVNCSNSYINRTPWITILFLFISVIPSFGSWNIDPYRYHISAHGTLGCTECHEDDIKGTHPDTKKLNLILQDFFLPSDCNSCHDEIEEGLSRGRHGRIKIKSKERFRNCISCHNPHYQLRLDKEFLKKISFTKPLNHQCNICHQKRITLPPPGEREKDCFICHVKKDENPPDLMCTHCHRKEESSLDATHHRDITCSTCHLKANSFPHNQQALTKCTSCHTRHHEGIIHDAHINVSCNACHTRGGRIIKDSTTGKLIWVGGIKGKSDPHAIQTLIDCARCHYKGNTVGASATQLPPKSILCMVCHSANLTIEDIPSWIGLGVFSFGILIWVMLFLGRGHHEEQKPRLKATESFHLKGLFLDLFFQRRLYKESKKRWFIHGLIFYGFLLRFIAGMLLMAGSRWTPESMIIWSLLNKNGSIHGLFFDITGIMVIAGVIAYIVEDIKRSRLPGMPKKGSISVYLIGLIIVSGFLTEGMRIAMSGFLSGSTYSFLGYMIAKLFFSDKILSDIYPVIWYIHSGFYALFFALIPFSRLSHIILAPVVYYINAKKR